jgi:hypothetical protein
MVFHHRRQGRGKRHKTHLHAEKAAVIEGQNVVEQQAKFAALYSIVQELAAHERVSEEQFLQRFQERVLHYRDYFLRIAENINPNWAGQIDVRGQSDMPEGESYPPLFPET